MKSILNIFYISILVLFYPITDIIGQVSGISLDNIDGCVGETHCIDLKVTNFNQIEGFELEFITDPSIIELVSFTPSTALSNIGSNLNLANTTGWLILLWSNDLGETTTLVDGTVIGQFCYRLVGDAGSCTNIDLLPESAFFGDSTGELIDYTPMTACITSCNDFDILVNWCNPTTISSTDGTLNVSACCGDAQYRVEIAALGGGGFIFKDNDYWTYNNVSVGTYTIEVTSIPTGVKQTKVITINAGQPIHYLSFDGSDPTCWSKSNGMLSIDNIFDGTPPYNLSWSNGFHEIGIDGTSTYTMSGLSSGTYDLTITDANGCTEILTKTIYMDTIFASAVLIDSATCAGISDGIVEVTGSRGIKSGGGAGGYYFNENIGAVPVVSKELNVEPGWFKFKVSGDPYNCYSEIDSIFVPAKGELHIAIDYSVPFAQFQENLDCFGDLTTIALTLTNGENITPFSTFYDSDNTKLSGGILGNNIFIQDDLGAGTYKVHLEGGNLGCTVDTIIVITEPDSLYMTATTTVPSCTSSDGSIMLVGVGGTPGYTYIWSDNGATSDTRTGLGSGLYTVTISDSKGCEEDMTFDFADGIALEIKIDTIQLISCQDANSGSISAIVTSGGNDFTYEWTSASAAVTSNNPILANLSADTYYLKVTDNTNGCEAFDTLSLFAVGDMKIDTILNLPSCHNTLDGSIAIQISGGSSPYEIDWEGYPVYKDIALLSGIGQGSYTVTVTDNGNCSVIETIILPGPDPIMVSVENIDPVKCFGTNTGSAVAKGANGSNGINYDYIWSSAPEDGSKDVPFEQATHLSSGTQWVIAFDGHCATDTFFFEVLEPEKLTLLDVTIANPTCANECDGSIDLLAGGGTPNYSYRWENGSIDKQQTNLCSDTFYITITDNNSCVLDTSIILVEPDTFLLSIDSINTHDISCNDNTGTITVLASGGSSGSYFYTWPALESTTETATNLAAGTYIISATDSKGCMDTTSYTLTPADAVVGNIALVDPIDCFGGETCIKIENVSGGVGNYSFSINNSPNFPIDSCVEVVAGDYDILIFDNAGCFTKDSVDILQPAQTFLSVSPMDPVFDLGQDPLVLDLLIQNSNAGTDTILWTPNADLDCILDDCTQVMTSPTKDITYQITRVDLNGCISKTSVTITVKNNRNVYFPNIFSPKSSQSENSLFSFELGAGVEELEYLRIFDRWGDELYVKKHILPGFEDTAAWDGTYKGSLLNPGVYVYIASVKFIDGKVIPYRGSITITR